MNTKKITSTLTLLALVVTSLITTSLPASAEDIATQLTNEEIAADSVFAPSGQDLIEFTINARWGYVRGNPTADNTEKIYDGSITALNADQARINLVKTLLFERTDQATTTANSVTWTSKISGHWDGAMVNTIAEAEANITVKAGPFTITKTAEDWFTQTTPAVERATDGQMLVVHIDKKKHRRAGVLIWWGKKTASSFNCITTPCVPPSIDFSGSLTMDQNSWVQLKRPLRFETVDKITEHDRHHIAWTSAIATDYDRDGLFALMLPSRAASTTDGFTITLNKVNNGWSKHYSWADVKNGVRETITIDNVDYLLAIGRNHIVEQLVKAQFSRRLYLIKDNIKHEIDSLDILTANGLKETDAVIMADDELESYEDGDYLHYPSGTVVQDDTQTYIIESNRRRLLPTREIISHFTDGNRLAARRISQLRLNRLEAGNDVSTNEEILDESLVKTPGSTAVWKINGNKRRVFTHLNIFNLHRHNFNQVRTITEAQLMNFTWAPPMEYPDGALVKIPTDPKVYLLSGGVRRWIETEADLAGLGFPAADIIDMPPTEITNYPEGQPIITDDPN